MKPVRFEYFDPSTREEVFKLLKEYEDDAKLLAGGQSLIPMLNFRIARPGTLIDINRVKDLAYIQPQNGHVRMGALTRERAIEKSDLIRSKIPLLTEATTHIGHVAIRNKGTIGGCIAHADPSAEYPLIMKMLGAEFKIESSGGSRWVRAEDFFLDYLMVDLKPGEMITEVKCPVPPPRTVHAFQELARRQGDFAIVAVGVMLTMDEKGRCKEARIGLGGVDVTPLRPEKAEEVLNGEKIDEKLIEVAAARAAEATNPTADMHASTEYRKEMAKVFTKRCLLQALKRYKEGTA